GSSALSTTTRWSSGRVCEASTASESASRSRRRWVTTTPTMRSVPAAGAGPSGRSAGSASGIAASGRLLAPHLRHHRAHVLRRVGALIGLHDLVDVAALSDLAVVDPHRRV